MLRSKGYFASIFLQFYKFQKIFALHLASALPIKSTHGYHFLSGCSLRSLLIDRVEGCKFVLYKSEPIDPAYKRYAVV